MQSYAVDGHYGMEVAEGDCANDNPASANTRGEESGECFAERLSP